MANDGTLQPALSTLSAVKETIPNKFPARCAVGAQFPLVRFTHSPGSNRPFEKRKHCRNGYNDNVRHVATEGGRLHLYT